jgi:prepilin-type N-terminal cleavage/methylation domain-containing protein
MQPLTYSRRRGFSIIELLIALAIIAVLLTIAVPMMMTAYLNAKETAVHREVLTIHQAQVQYLSQFGEYANSLGQLGPPAGGVAGPHGAKLIPATLASGDKNGYLYTVTKTTSGFAVNANPKVFGRNGRRSFYVDEDGVVHQNWGVEPASAASPEVK